MQEVKILWIDDEIDLLKVHILLLEEKGYKVSTANNAEDGFDMIKKNNYDIIFIDENMPGISGLEILPRIKREKPTIPIIMITKREEEEVMDEAVGSKIDGYLIKPINPKQILISIKKNVHNKDLISEKTVQKYQSDFRELSNQIAFSNSFEEWTEIYKKIVFWDLELETTDRKNMQQILIDQKKQANKDFAKFVEKNYNYWIESKNDRPPMLFDIMDNDILPMIDNGEKIFLIVIDNLRFDQWKNLKPYFSEYLNIIDEQIISSILPTATQYARNSFFAGLSPAAISETYPQFWLNEEDQGNKNDFEEQLVNKFFERKKRNINITYHKILNEDYAYSRFKNIKSLKNNELNIFVFNFVDMLSHAKTNLQMIKDLARDEKAYRSLVNVWFEHSFLKYLLKEISKLDVSVILTTDHGSVQVRNPVKVVGDRHSSTNIRYKQGKNLNYNKNKVFEIKNPLQAGLPKSNITSKYIFAKNYDYLVYPKNYNHFVKYYKDTFQHGGLSIEEMLIPFIVMSSKQK